MALMGFKPDLLVTDAMLSLFTQVTCCIRGPLKERLKPGPKSVASVGIKPDLFVTDAMFFLFTQATCSIREPLKKEVKAWTKICAFNGIQTRPLCY